MLELADRIVSNTIVARRIGSTPITPTNAIKYFKKMIQLFEKSHEKKSRSEDLEISELKSPTEPATHSFLIPGVPSVPLKE